MPESRAYRRVQAERAGVDVQNLQAVLEFFLERRRVIGQAIGRYHTDEAKNALQDVADQITDYVLPTLKAALDDIEEIYHVSREGAVDSEE